MISLHPIELAPKDIILVECLIDMLSYTETLRHGYFFVFIDLRQAGNAADSFLNFRHVFRFEVFEVPHPRRIVALPAYVERAGIGVRPEDHLELGRPGVNIAAPTCICVEVIHCATDRAFYFDVNNSYGREGSRDEQVTSKGQPP